MPQIYARVKPRTTKTLLAKVFQLAYDGGQSLIAFMSLSWFAIGWTVFVLGAWISQHSWWLQHAWLASFWFLSAFGVSFLGIVWWLHQRPNSERHEHVLHCGEPLGGGFLMTWYVFILAEALFPFSGRAIVIRPMVEWFMGSATFAIELLMLVAILTITYLVLSTTGNGILRFLKFRSFASAPPLLVQLITLAFGIAGWIYIALLLAAIGWLRGPLVLGLAALILIIEHSWRSAILPLWKKPLIITHPLPWQSLVLIAFLAFFSASSLIDSLRPIPSGYDDMTAYMNHAQLIATRGTLVPGGLPFPFEILAATLEKAAPGPGLLFGMSLGTLALFLAALALWGLCCDFFDRRTALVAVTLWLSLPMTGALVFREVKPDPLLAFCLILTFWVMLRSLRSQSSAQLPIIAFLFGLAISVKLTALFFIGPFLVAAFVLRRQIRDKRLHFGRLFGQASIAFLLPLIPWFALSFGTRPAATPISPSSFLSSSSPSSISDAAVWKKLGINPTDDCFFTGEGEDRARFLAPRPAILRTFFAPWDLTMNTGFGQPATEIGFLLLAFLPWLLFGLARAPTDTSLAIARTIATMAAGYFFLWLCLGHFILWYALPGFMLLSILIAWSITRAVNNRLLSHLLWALLFFGLTANTLLRFTYSLPRTTLDFAAGRSDMAAYQAALFPAFLPVLNLIDTDGEARMLIAGSGLRYFIHENDRRVITDQYLDTFNCLNQPEDVPGTLNRLRSFGIKYVYISADTLAHAEDDAPPSLQGKVRRFTLFAKRALTPLIRTRVGILYSMP